ncbi:MAG: ABC transporter substrate-binding protein [Tistlia sp.]|uniref:ABC transporter substrate-binding protein n=1 Tax=Tistlia sp. TaxID=3057121 RepID=UPI0034A337F8
MKLAFCAMAPARPGATGAPHPARLGGVLLRWFLAVLLVAGAVAPATAADALEVPIVYLTLAEQPRPPLSLVEPTLHDEGVAGAKVGIDDNNTTGRFLNQSYSLTEVVAEDWQALTAEVARLLAEGRRYFVADVGAEPLLAVADLAGAEQALIFNVRAEDDGLRIADCRPNLLHVIPSRAMKADALAQFLMARRWSRWFLVEGQQPDDRAFAEALRRAAGRFGARIVETRPYDYDPMARRTDTGHVQIQRQMTALTQEVPDYDVLVVADESDLFGEYLPYRTWDPRPVVGTQGLVPTAWHRSQEQWGGTQMQTRFENAAGRGMVERDYAAWVAVRAIGEAVTRGSGAEAESVKGYLLSDAFRLGAFKGEGLTFRPWNQQLRQPMLLASARMLASVSPQEGYLHERTPLDSLGYDEPESDCRLN